MTKFKIYHVFPVIIFLLCLQGVNLSDEGYHILNQWTAWTTPKEYIWGFTWLTDWIGGGWLALTEPLGIFGYRLGWAFCFLGILGFTSKLYEKILPENTFGRWGIYFFAGVFVIHGVIAPDYLVQPALISTLAMGLMMWGWYHQDKKTLILGSLLLGALPGFRFPMIVSWVIPVLILIWERLRLGKIPADRLKSLGVIFCGFFISSFFLGLILWANGYLDEHIEYFRRAFLYVSPGHSHNPTHLLESYVREAIIFPIRDGLQFFLISWLVVLSHRVFKGRYFVPLLTLILTSYFIYRGLNTPNLAGNRQVFVSMAIFSAGFILIQRMARKVKFDPLEGYLIAGIFVTLAGIVGSENGLGVSVYFSALIWGPLIVLMLSSFGAYRVVAQSLAMAALLSSVAIRFVNPYLDDRDRRNLIYPVTSCTDLRWVLTSKERAEALNGACEFLTQVKAQNKSFVASNQAPLLYYLGRQLPPLYYSWLESSDLRDFEVFEQEMKKSPKDIWIVTKSIPSRSFWPAELSESDRVLVDNIKRVEKMRADLGYTRLLWENNGFEAYAKAAPL